MTKLSANFSLAELIRSDKASRAGLDNTPDAKITANLQLLCKNILQPVRDAIGVSMIITSGYRSPVVNTAVGGSKTSAHRYGYAADLHCPSYKGGSIKELCIFFETFLKKNGIKFDQLIYEFGNDAVPTAGWVHIGIKSSSGLQRGQLLVINGNGTRLVKTFK